MAMKESAMKLLQDVMNDPKILVDRTMEMPFEVQRYVITNVGFFFLFLD